jgi:hypothetical protein
MCKIARKKRVKVYNVSRSRAEVYNACIAIHHHHNYTTNSNTIKAQREREKTKALGRML